MIQCTLWRPGLHVHWLGKRARADTRRSFESGLQCLVILAVLDLPLPSIPADASV